MDVLNVFSSFSSGSSTAPVMTEEVQMNSLFANNRDYETHARDNGDMGIWGAVLVGFVLVCIFFIRKLQNS